MEFVVALIKQVAPEVVNVPCIIHRKALLAKKVVNQENNCQLADVISIATAALKNAKSNCAFQEIVKGMEDEGRLVYHSEVRWLSRGRVMKRVWKVREELVMWFNGQEDHKAHLIQDLLRLTRLAYLNS